MYAELTTSEILGRLLMGGYFLIMLVKNLRLYRWNVERMAENGVPLAELVLPAGFAVQLAGSVLILLDLYVALGVALLLLFTFVATAIFHRFWLMDDPVKRNYHMLLGLNNVGITGGLLLIL